MLNIKYVVRFWKKVDHKGKTKKDCWEWTGCCMKNGYGVFNYDGKHTKLAHRVAFMIAFPDIYSEDLFCLHKCDNRRCCNPNHLYVGTAQMNSDDKISRKRDRFIGEQNGQSVLTEQDIYSIRNMYATTDLTQNKIAEKFGISGGHVCNIVNRKVWKHLIIK